MGVKRLSTGLAAVCLAASLVLGVADDGALAPHIPGENGLYLSQLERVGISPDRDQEGAEKFVPFLDLASPLALIPGLNQNLVPQGLARNEETGYLYVTGYFPALEDNPFVKGGNPSAVAVLNPEGQLVAEYVLRQPDGSPFQGHVGGVAVCHDTLFLSAPFTLNRSGKRVNRIAAIPLEDLVLEGHQEVRVKEMIPVPVQPSYLSARGDILWLGNFFQGGYSIFGPPRGLGTTQVPGEEEGMSAYLFGYDLSEGGLARLEPEEGQTFALPDPGRCFLLPEKVQGMAQSGDGTLYVSQSYGNRSASILAGYDPDLAYGVSLTLEGREVEGRALTEASRTFRCTVLPMAEGLTAGAGDNTLLMLFESGAALYDGGRGMAPGIFRTDAIWTVTPR